METHFRLMSPSDSSEIQRDTDAAKTADAASMRTPLKIGRGIPGGIWFLVTLAFCAMLPFFFSAKTARKTFFLELTLQTSLSGSNARLYFDIGEGFNEWHTAVAEPSPTAQDRIRFALPARTIRALRLDPFDKAGTAVLGGIRICDDTGHTLHAFEATDIKSLNQISTLDVMDRSSVRLITAPEATDPYVALHLDKPTQLKAPFDPLRRLARSAPMFVLALATLLLGAWVKQRWIAGAPSPFPKWPVLIAVTLVLFARMPDRFLNPQFYAEDGLWYSNYVADGWKSFFAPYGGYLLLVDRVVACLAAQVPLIHAPAVMNAAALLMTLLVAARILSRRNPLPYKPWLALAIVLLPHPDDTLVTITNIQWVLALALVVLLISEDASDTRGCWHDYATSLLAGLTGVHCIILFPLFVVRFILRKSRHSAALLALIGLAACTQAWFVVHAPALQPNNPVPFSEIHVPAILGFQLFVQLFFSTWFISPGSVSLLAIIGIAAIGLYVTLGFPQKTNFFQSRNIFLVAAAFLYSAASIFRFKAMLPMFLSPEGLSRYFFVPQILLIWLLLAGLREEGWRKALSSVFLVALATSTFSFFRAAPLIDYRWREEVLALKPGQPTAIAINPKGWVFQLPPAKNTPPPRAQQP